MQAEISSVYTSYGYNTPAPIDFSKGQDEDEKSNTPPPSKMEFFKDKVEADKTLGIGIAHSAINSVTDKLEVGHGEIEETASGASEIAKLSSKKCDTCKNMCPFNPRTELPTRLCAPCAAYKNTKDRERYIQSKTKSDEVTMLTDRLNAANMSRYELTRENKAVNERLDIRNKLYDAAQSKLMEDRHLISVLSESLEKIERSVDTKESIIELTMYLKKLPTRCDALITARLDEISLLLAYTEGSVKEVKTSLELIHQRQINFEKLVPAVQSVHS